MSMVRKITLPLTALAVYSLLKNLLFCDDEALGMYENTVVLVEINGEEYELCSAELRTKGLDRLVFKVIPTEEYE